MATVRSHADPLYLLMVFVTLKSQINWKNYSLRFFGTCSLVRQRSTGYVTIILKHL